MYETLRRSPFTRVVPRKDGNFAVYHALHGRASSIDADTVCLLRRFNTPRTLEEVLDEAGPNPVREFRLRQLVDKSILVRDGTDERAELSQSYDPYLAAAREGRLLDGIYFSVTNACNFACTYCMADLSGRKVRISPEMAKRALQKYVDLARRHGKKELLVGFVGGEPLLYWDIVHGVMCHAREKYGDEFDLQLSLNTNGSLVTPEMARSLKELNVHLSLSLDGPPQANDLVRIQVKGGKAQGTFEQIEEGWHNLREAGIQIYGFYCTLAAANIALVDESLVDFAVRWSVQSITLEPDLTQPLDIGVEELIDKLLRIWTYAESKGIYIAGSWKLPAHRAVQAEATHKLHNCMSSSGEHLTFFPGGAVHDCPYTGEALGHVDRFDEIFTSPDYLSLISKEFSGAIEMCRGCEIEGLCKGGCRVHRIHAAKDEPMMDKKCDFLRRMTRRILSEAEFAGEPGSV